MNAARKNRLTYVLAGLVLCVLGMGTLIIFPALPDPTSVSLIVRSTGEIAIPLPAGCARVASVDFDAMARYLEDERNRRGLIAHQWITCKELSKESLQFVNDTHWLPSYVPGTYQYRRTVIIVPYAQPVPQGSPIIAEVCLMPWPKYIRQIAGEGTGKYSVWK